MKQRGFILYLSNTLWMLSARIFRILLAFIAVIWVAKYLGPLEFGIYNYALSFVMIFSVFLSLGLENLLVREFLQNPADERRALGTALLLKLAGTLLLVILAIFSITLVRPSDQLMLALVSIISFGMVFKVFDVIRFWLEAQVKGKYVAIAEVASIAASLIFKAVLILFEAPLIYFAWSIAVESLILMVCLLIIYNRQGNSIRNWSASFATMRHLLQNAWPLILAGTLYTLYTRIDQIMLGEMVGHEAVGVYAIAIKISEAWLFIPAVLATSLYPSMLNVREKDRPLYLERTQHLMNLMVIIAIAAAIGITLIAYPLVWFALGAEYKEAVWIVMVHIWGGLFLAMSHVSYRYFIAEGLQKHSFYRGLTGVFINIGLNIWLIPLWGGMGAAVATVISQMGALYFFNAWAPQTREIFHMQTRALFLISAKYSFKYIYRLRNGS